MTNNSEISEQKKMPTVTDVAKLAGVSPITVSRVVNNSGYISAHTRAKVLDAIQQTGYVPNTLARGLRLSQTKMLALVITDITNPFFTTVVRGVEDAASDRGYNIILCNTDESVEEEDRYLRLLIQKHVDGIILVPAQDRLESIRFVQSNNVPIVLVDREIPGSGLDTVRCDSVSGAARLVDLLIDAGHRRIAALGGPHGVQTAEARVQGYRETMQTRGLPVSPAWIERGELKVESGYRMAAEVLKLEPRPTAIFACNNFLAIGTLKAVWDAGLRVPEDISVVSYDDLPEAMIVEPFLTAISQPAYNIGYQATEMLVQRLEGNAPSEGRNLILPSEVILRRSNAPPREESA